MPKRPRLSCNVDLGQNTIPLKRRPLTWFFLLAFGITWTVMLAILFFRHAIPTAWYAKNLLPNLHPDRSPTSALQLVTSWGPAVAALWVTAVISGVAGVKGWLSRWTRWRVGWKWYAIALFFPPVLSVVQYLATRPAVFEAYIHQPARTVIANQVGQYLAWLIPGFLWIVGGEEGGWRGFALPRLQERYGPVLGTTILAVLWEAWHLPTILRPGHPYYDLGAVAVSLFLLRGLLIWNCYATICTWIFNNTRGSLLPVILWHSSVNATVLVEGDIFRPAGATLPGHALGDWILWPIVAGALIWFTRGRLGYQPENRPSVLHPYKMPNQ